jgi:hypothetical protein
MGQDLYGAPSYFMNIYNVLLKNYDIVIASRYVKGGSSSIQKPLHGIISRGASLMT